MNTRQGGLRFKNAARMLYGLYLSAQGAQNQTLRLNTIANNVANANTTAFKRDLAVFQDHLPFDLEHGNLTHPPGGLNQSTGGTTIAFTQTDFTEGPLINTKSDFDIALTGPGFLQVRDGKETFLTRNGQLTQNALGEIVTQDQGWPVLNTEGDSIVVPPGASQITITADGLVFAGNELGEQIALGQLNVVEPAQFESLEKLGDSLYRAHGPIGPPTSFVQIRQGYLETSGVNPIAETVQMIDATRAFEANINMIRFQDESLSRLLQSLIRQ
jgi:flagellar basal-body rod protein FlgF